MLLNSSFFLNEMLFSTKKMQHLLVKIDSRIIKERGTNVWSESKILVNLDFD